MIRYKAFATLETKDADSGIFKGYAATWNRDSDGDRFEAGAFGATIKERKGKIPILLHHERMFWAGVSTDLSEDKKGLWLEAQLFLDTSYGRDAWGTVKNSVAAGFTPGLSVGFVPTEVDWDDGAGTRVIKSVDLWETSITPFPANTHARVEEAKAKAIRNYERLLRDVTKCSAAEAKRILAMLPLAMSVDTDVEPLTPARDVRGTKQLIDTNVREAMRSLRESIHA